MEAFNMTNQHKQRIQKMYDAGMSVSKIADTLGIPRSTVQSFLKKLKTEDDCNACKNCGEAILITAGHRPRQFCSDYCRLRFWRSQRKHTGATT